MTNRFSRLTALMVFSLAVLFFTSFHSHASVGDTFTKDQLKYTVYTEDKATKTGTVSVEAESTEITGDVVIPEAIENNGYTYSVTILPNSAFYGCSRLKSITISDSIPSIGTWTFANCYNLTRVVVGNSVTSIGYATFEECYNLTNVYFKGDAPNLGGYDVFRGRYPTICYLKGTSGWTNTFGGCLTVECVGWITQNEIIYIYKIDGTASANGYTEEINIAIVKDVISVDSVDYRVISIEKGAFYDCDSLTSIVIPNSVTSIGERAFYSCDNLIGVVIPDSVTDIGTSAFSYCSSLTSIEIGNSLVKIVSSVFYKCNSLTSITIPDSVTSIGGFSFNGCNSLTNIVIPDSVTSIGNDAFKGCSSLATVYFKGNAPEIYNTTTFTAPSVIYYRSGTTGWTNPWSGRPTTLWIEAPEIEEQPKSQAVLEGDSVTFTVSTEGTAPLNYQWYKDDIAIEGATGETYTIESVTAEDLGNYQVVVTNTEGEAVSNIAVLSLLQPPTITVNPVSVTVDNGTNVAFTVEALNADSYQWYKDGTAISGATETTYSIDYVKGSDVGTYTAMAINRAGAEKSSPAVLSLTQPYRATAELQMVNGFIVGVTVTDCGWGYEFEPKVRFKDEFGEGAEAHCVVENGMVTAIILDNPGSGYSEETTVKVGSPFKYVGLKAEVKQIKLTLYLVLGETYQLEACTDIATHDWKRIGDPFIADEEETEVIVEVLETGRYFRVHEVK